MTYFYNFVYFIFGCARPWLLQRLLSSCSEQGLLSSCGVQASHCGGFACCRAQALGARALVVVAYELSSCSSWALEHRLSGCGTLA